MSTTISICGLTFIVTDSAHGAVLKIAEMREKRITEYLLFKPGEGGPCNSITNLGDGVLLPKGRRIEAQFSLYDYLGRNISSDLFLRFNNDEVTLKRKKKGYSATQKNILLLGCTVFLMSLFTFVMLRMRPGNIIDSIENSKVPVDMESAPDVKVGDSYISKNKNCRVNSECKWSITRRNVVEVTPETVTLNSIGDAIDKTGERKIIYNRENGFIGNHKSRYEPAIPYYKFPLKVGKEWRGTFMEYKVANTNNEDGILHHYYGKVIARESIKVEAGEFDVWKVYFEHTAKSGASENKVIDTSWYAPAVKKAVKSEIEDWIGGERVGSRYSELVSYYLK